MVEEGIRGGMCHAVRRYAKGNNKYMKNYDEKEESSFLQYLDANNLYEWAMEQNLPAGGFEWVNDVSKIDEDFIKNYDENPKQLHDLHSDLPFLPERMEINKCSKLVYNLFDKKTVLFTLEP